MSLQKCKVSAPFFPSIKLFKAEGMKTGADVAREMKNQVGGSFDFSNFAMAINGNPVKADDPIPDSAALMIEISEAENESGFQK